MSMISIVFFIFFFGFISVGVHPLFLTLLSLMHKIFD